jgi:cell filamentation protein
MTSFVDPYLDPRSGVLRNLVGAKSEATLARAEGDLSSFRLIELAHAYTVRRTGDLAELRGVHRHLFQDVYAWAGEIRTVDLAKGGSTFVPARLIDRAAGNVFKELRAEGFLRGLDREGFVDRIAQDAGWSVDWSGVTREGNVEASRVASTSQDLAPLREMFDSMTTAGDSDQGRT